VGAGDLGPLVKFRASARLRECEAVFLSFTLSPMHPSAFELP
jgi:hypothetical protein